MAPRPEEHDLLHRKEASLTTGTVHGSRVRQALTRLSGSREVLWIGSGQAGAVLAALAGVTWLTKFLPPGEYGQLALMLTLANLVGLVIFGPLAAAASRFLEPARERQEHRALLQAVADLVVRRGRWFALGSLGAALVCGLLGGPAIAAFALLAALFSFVFCMTTVCESILNAGRLRREVAVHRALQQVLNYGLAIGLIALWTSSSLVAALGFCAGVATTAASEWRVLRARLWATSPEHRGAEAIAEWDAKVRAYARPYERWGGLQWLQTASDRWALLLASGVADAGLYAVVYQLGYTPLGLLATLLVQTIEPVAFSRAGDASAVERLARAQRLRRQTMALFGGMTLVVVLAAWLLHRVVFEAFIAPAYWPVSPLLPWMALAAGLFGLGQLQAVKWLILVRPERMQTARTVLAAIGIGFIAAGAFLGGATGVAIGQVLSSLLFFAGMAALR